jgi:hypothetical protein
MEAGLISILCYVVSAAILVFWSVESALSQPGSAKLLVCGVMMAGIGFGLPRAM